MALAIASLWTTPRLGQAPTVASPGSWLVMTVIGLILALIGVLCLTGLLAPTPGRHWALGSLLSMLIGTVALAPVLGVVGLGWPSADQVGSAAALAAYQSSPDGGPVLRWLGVGGLLLLGLSWSLLAIGLAASRVYSTTDGVLVLLAVLLAVLAVRIQVLEVAASIMLLAAGLGLARTAARTRT
jgi:hypothetical protein